MTVVNDREELKQFCLRKLGAPTIKINIADDQLEDRIDDALQYFNEWHVDGVTKVYLKHKPTTTTLTFAAPSTGTFGKGDVITGSNSKVMSVVYSAAADGLSVQVWQTGTLNNGEARFAMGEPLTCGPNKTATLAAAVYGDLDNRYIPIPPQVISIVKLFPISAGTSANYLFDPVYYTAFD
jgi:hypothetical protein